MTKRYFILIERIDNRLVIQLNDNQIFDSGIIQEDPVNLGIVPLEITTLLQAGSYVNRLRFAGYNGQFAPGHQPQSDTNPWHFRYQIILNTYNDSGLIINSGPVVPIYDDHGYSANNSLSIDHRYSVVKELKSDEFNFTREE